MPIDYQNGKIYKIVSDSTDKIYIGSTCNLLSKRLYEHKKGYEYYMNGKCHFTTSYNILKLGDAEIILIENFPCLDKNELYARERYWIELNKDILVNKQIPTRTQKEYYHENIVKIKAYGEEYRKNNDDKIIARGAVYRDSHKEEMKHYNKQYRVDNNEKLKQYIKQYTDENKENLKEYKNTKHNCECGGTYSNTGKSYHFSKSKKHIKYIESITTTIE